MLKLSGKLLESKVNGLKAVMQDLKAEASFFYSTASNIAEDLVKIKEIKEYEEDNSTKMVFRSGLLRIGPFSDAENDDEDNDIQKVDAENEASETMSGGGSHNNCPLSEWYFAENPAKRVIFEATMQ